MDKNKRAILLGLAIGDGCIYKSLDKRSNNPKPSYTLSIQHSSKQKEYVEHKAELLHSVMGGKKPNVRNFDNSGYPGTKFSKGHRVFGLLYKRLYVGGKKTLSRRTLEMLTPQSIALWYMDDGNLSMKRREGKIHGRELFINTHITKEENQVIIDYFIEVHGIHFTQVKNRGHYRLRCGSAEAKKFIAIISPYIIPSMNYKIDMQYIRC